MDLERIVAELKREREQLSRAIACAGGNRLASGYFKSEGRRFCAHRERKETRPPHRGGQKAVVGGDEEALGGTSKEGSIKTPLKWLLLRLSVGSSMCF